MKKFYIIISVILLILVWIFIYNKLFFTEAIVKFEDLEPFSGKMQVYLKGFKIGKTENIFPDKDFSNTYMKIKLSKRNLNLPENIKAELKHKDGTNYINIIYPSSPSIKRLKNGSIIQGEYQKNIDNFINEAINGENIQDLMGNASNLMDNANKTVISLCNVFDEITGILKDIRPNLKIAVQNIKNTTTNLSNISGNLENALGIETTKNSVDNIEAVTENIKKMTFDLNKAAAQINDISIPIVNTILCETKGTIENTNEITRGLKCTLKKKFGAFRLFFGTAVNDNCCKPE